MALVDQRHAEYFHYIWRKYLLGKPAYKAHQH